MLKNTILLGTTVSTTSRQSSMVNAMSVVAPTGNAVMLINQSVSDTTVNLVFENWAPGGETFELHTITSKGYTVQTMALDTDLSHFPVKRESIAVLRFQPGTDVTQKNNQSPVEHGLMRAYPNPFNPSTTIQFSLDKASHVNVDVFNLAGRHISSLLSKKMPGGEFNIVWNAVDQPNGVYIIQLETENSVRFIKVSLLK
jgi:hypothetical protein